MKTKKLLALLLSAAMLVTMAGCGAKDDAETDAPVVEDGAADDAADPAPAGSTEASIDFEDGLFGFVGNDLTVAGALGESIISVADFGGSKALSAVSTGKFQSISFQIDALLGDNVSKVKTIELSVGVGSPDGNFYACSGKMYGWLGEDRAKDAQAWSVYLETANPKTAVYTVPDGQSFVAGNTFVVSLETDNAKSEEVGNSTLYIDNLTFKDADGNVLAADSSAEFVQVDTGHDPNLLYLSDAVEIEGFQASAGGWSQAGISLTEEQKALFVPGSVIEISYSCDTPVWFVAICGEDNPNPMGGWLRGISDTFVPDGYVSTDGSTVQYTYEQLVPYFGEDFGQYLDTLQCEGQSDWEVYSVKVGKNSGYVTLGSATEIEGFQASAGGWSQAGITLTEEQKALFVPGSVIEISYSCDTPVWFVAICNEDNPNPMGGWLRGINDTFVPDGAVSEDGSSIQYTYEQLVPYFGEDFGQFLDTLQCEGQTDWEVYSVKVGKPMYPAHNTTEIEGFQASADGWSQAGIDLTEEQKALFVPGSVITINYSCDTPVWFVAICGEDNPNPMGGWLRGVNDTFVPDGAVSADGSSIQYTYEQLVPYFGEDFGQYLNTLQCEGQSAWEVYGVTVGMRN